MFNFGCRATGNHVSQQNVDYGSFENEILEVIRRVPNLSYILLNQLYLLPNRPYPLHNQLIFAKLYPLLNQLILAKRFLGVSSLGITLLYWRCCGEYDGAADATRGCEIEC